MKITRLPFRDIDRDRWNFCLEHKLVETIAGFSRITNKAKKYYGYTQMVDYLQCRIEKPERLDRKKLIKSLLEM